LKIALVRKAYNPFGGAENYLRLVAQGLRTKGHEVHIFTRNKWSQDTFTIHEVKSIGKPSFVSNIHFAIKSRKTLKKEHFDCILSFERTIYQDIYRAGDGCHREWLNKRSVIESPLKKLSFLLNPLHLILLYLERECFHRSKVIIANSTMVKNDIIRHYSIPENKIHVIYNGVDIQRFHPLSKDKKIALRDSLGLRDDRIILFVGADFERKGLPALLRAFSILNQDDVKLMVAGRTRRKKYLSLIKKLGIKEKVIIYDAQPEIERFYAVADIFVLPTIYDPFSNATLEAMASGLPVITTSSNGASELIEGGIHGFIIDNPLDIRALAEKISIALLTSEEMGKRARIRAEGFSIEKAIDELIKVISEYGR